MGSKLIEYLAGCSLVVGILQTSADYYTWPTPHPHSYPNLQHKGDLNCDICKRLITNLPSIDPAILEAKEAARRRRLPNFSVDSAPSSADHIFDCVRVAWIAMIILILILDMPVNQAMMYGLAMGMGYVVLAKALYSCTRALRAGRVRRQVAREEQARQQGQLQQQLQQPLANNSSQGLRQPLLSGV